MLVVHSPTLRPCSFLHLSKAREEFIGNQDSFQAFLSARIRGQARLEPLENKMAELKT